MCGSSKNLDVYRTGTAKGFHREMPDLGVQPAVGSKSTMICRWCLTTSAESDSAQSKVLTAFQNGSGGRPNLVALGC
jgi:hypothetical protein